MPPSRKISYTQLEELVTWMELHPQLVNGSHLATIQVKQYNNLLWQELASRLNANSNGCIKNMTGWRQYWSDIKSKVRKKGATVVEHASATWEDILTPIEGRILSLARSQTVSGNTNGHIIVDMLLDDSTSLSETQLTPPRVTQSMSPFDDHTTSNNISCPIVSIAAEDSDESERKPARAIKRRHSDGADLNSDGTAAKLTARNVPHSTFDIEDSGLCEEEQRLSLDERWLALDERRLALDQRRLALDEQRLALDDRRLALDDRRLALDEQRLALDDRRMALSCRTNGEKEPTQSIQVKNIEELK